MVALAWPGSPVRAAEPEVEFLISPSDTLIGLSERVLVTPDAWREVARRNKLRNPNRLEPGQVLRIPLRLLRSVPLNARVVSVNGDVRIGGAVATQGSTLAEGQALETGADGSAVIELADRSRVKVAPSSLTEVISSRRYAGPDEGRVPDTDVGNGWFAGAMRVLKGSVEVFATKVLRAKPLEVTTPTAVVGVRGTEYRVSFDAAANNRSRSEVLDGKVRFDAADAAIGADVAKGFGAAIEPGVSAPQVAKLLDAPELGTVPQRFERPLVRFALAGERTPLRVQVSPDASFDKLVIDQRIQPGTDVRLAGLPDATWHMRARRIDSLGLEGFDAQRTFVLKARPEPPASNQPRRGAKLSVGQLSFAWAENIDAQAYRFQLAADPDFKTLVAEQARVEGTKLELNLPKEGQYHWRLASIKAAQDQGPFGDPQSFELRALPEPPKGGLDPNGKSLQFAWGARPEDRHRVELARDPEFKEIVATSELKSPEWNLATPIQSGSYYFRYQTIEPDGFVHPYSSTLKTEVPRDWSYLMLLVPLLFGL
jgi:hypothetical protein